MEHQWRRGPLIYVKRLAHLNRLTQINDPRVQKAGPDFAAVQAGRTDPNRGRSNDA